MFAGWITIKTDLETDKFDKKYKRIEENRAKLENKKIKIEADIETNENELRNYDELKNKANEYKSKLQEIAEARKQETLANPEQVITYGGTDKYKQLVQEETEIRAELSNINSELKTADKTVDNTANKNEILKEKLTEINSQLQKNNEEMNKVKLEQHNAEVEKVKKGFDNVGNSIQSAVKQAGRMVLSIFGIRSAVMALRSASSTLSTYDQQYASNLEYIRFVLAQMIAPVLQWIISLASTLLNYLYYILNAWFGIGRSVNVSANAFKKAKVGASGVDKATKSTEKSTKGTEKSVKEIKKTIAGFDDMDVLDSPTTSNDQKNGGNGGGSGGIGSSGNFVEPSFDIGKGLGEGNVPPWLKWIAENKDIVIAGLAGIAAGLIAVKMGAKSLMAIGIGIVVAGIVMLIKDIIEFVKNPSWENFANILIDISIILVGISIILIAIKATNPVAWILLIVAGIGVLIAAIIKNWDSIKAVLGEIAGWIYNHIIQPVANFFVGLFTSIVEGVKTLWNNIISFITSIPEWIYNNILVPIFNFFLDLSNKISSGISDIKNGIISTLSSIAGWVYSNVFQPIINFFSNMINNIRNGLYNIGNIFSNIFNGMKNVANNVINSIINIFHNLKGTVSNVVNSISSIIKNVINSITGGINTLIRGINRVNFTTPSWIPGIGGKSFGFHIPQIPRLKTGGIVNIPNKGLNIGGAIVGESGSEGVIPLTDPQAMKQLGQEIGKWITINANIINTMNGRVISRQMQKINANRDFATNN